MKIARPALLGIAPGVVATLGCMFFPTPAGNVLMSAVYVLGVACCFWAGFGIADQCVRSPGRNLAAGFSITALFFAINLGVLLAIAAQRSKEYSNEQREREILEEEQRRDTERRQRR
jgi:hypothetical protein